MVFIKIIEERVDSKAFVTLTDNSTFVRISKSILKIIFSAFPPLSLFHRMGKGGYEANQFLALYAYLHDHEIVLSLRAHLYRSATPERIYHFRITVLALCMFCLNIFRSHQ